MPYNVGMEEKIKKNYDLEMQKVLSAVKKGEKLLMQACCAPCSSACLERLDGVFDVGVLFYNPNIDDVIEYEKRKGELIRFLEETGLGKFVDCEYEREKFYAVSKGLEKELERGKRCYECYKLRLEKTAQIAKELGYAYFCTTLSLSPYKNAEWINRLGKELEEKYGVKFLPSDFKKRGGYARSLELSQQYGLYRQDYCGCSFSKAEVESKRALGKTDEK